MVKNYCHKARRQMLPVLMKTLTLTHDYMNHAPIHASKLLFEHLATFQVCRLSFVVWSCNRNNEICLFP